MAKVEDRLLDHNYDGILEYDNPLPGWWVWLFILTTIFAGIYLFYYHLAEIGELQEQEYISEIKAVEAAGGSLAQRNEKLWANVQFVALDDATALNEGKEIFVKNCVSCHGPDGGGGIGPNMTDNFYIHGKGIEATMNTVINGVPEKGMVSWKAILKPEEVQKVASYVLSLHGTTPTNPKAPQGVEVK